MLVTSKGDKILLDVADAQYFKKHYGAWFVTSHGYAATDVRDRGKSKRVYLHRLVLARKLKRDVEKNLHTDHVNGNKLDNRRENLREVTPKQNTWNTHTEPSGVCGYRGVSRLKLSDNYRAYINVGRKQIPLGVFATAEEAAYAYNLEVTKRRGKFAKLNNVPAVVLKPITFKVGESGLRGVRSCGNKWVARKKIKGVEYHIGVFTTLEEAEKARANFLPPT